MQKPSMASQAATLDLDLQLDLVPRGSTITNYYNYLLRTKRKYNILNLVQYYLKVH